MSTHHFELCAFNIQSCLLADKLGVYRVELCDNPVEGGTTPGYGTIRQVRERTGMKLYPILRPRAGDYFYDDDEIAILEKDIQICKELGCDGISIGVQRIDGEIDTERMKRFVELAYPMGVTCNRAFDATPDPMKALEDLIDCGCERILTSGQEAGAPQGVVLLKALVKRAGNRIIVMPGAGITAENIGFIQEATAATEFHGSLRKPVKRFMASANPKVLDSGQVYLPDEKSLSAILDYLRSPAFPAR